MSNRVSLKERIHSGETLYTIRTPVEIGRSELEGLLGQGKCDFLSVDSQHVAFSEGLLVEFCAIAEELDIPVHFRIPHTRHAYLIGRYLDLGPTGILVPEVIDELTIQEAMASFYYPQLGKRSWGGLTRHGVKARGDQLDRLEYAEWWNRRGVLSIQLESVEAIVHARQLAKPGIDLLCFGLNDLAFSLEGHPDHPFKTVEECIRNVAQQMKGSTIRLMTTVNTPAECDQYLDLGVSVLCVPQTLLPKR